CDFDHPLAAGLEWTSGGELNGEAPPPGPAGCRRAATPPPGTGTTARRARPAPVADHRTAGRATPPQEREAAGQGPPPRPPRPAPWRRDEDAVLAMLRRWDTHIAREGQLCHEGHTIGHPGLRAALFRWPARLPDGRHVFRLDGTRYAHLDVADTPLV